MSSFFRIVGYHSINKKDNPYICAVNITTIDHFAKHIEYFVNNYTIISCEQMSEMFEKKNYRKGRYVAITFDDGYLDFILNAYPVLVKHDIPVTIFLSTDYVNGSKIKWDDELTYVISSFSSDEDFIRWFNSNFVELNSKNKTELISKLQMQNPEEIEAIMGKVKKLSGIYGNEKIMMSWREISELAHDEKIEFGSHSCSHANMTLLDDERIKKELRESCEIMESHTGKKMTGFCYPYGRYDGRVKEILREEGFKYAVTSEIGVNNNKSDPFELKRIVDFNYPVKTLKKYLSLKRHLLRQFKRNIFVASHG